MTTSTGSEQLGILSDITCRQSLETTMQETQQLKGQDKFLGNITVPGLTEHLSQVEQHVAKLMCVNMARSQENLNNGNTNINLELEDLDLENKDVTRSVIQDQATRLADMLQVVVARDKATLEMRSRFSRNRQILTSNWEHSESEVRRLDEIYHDTQKCRGKIQGDLEQYQDREKVCMASMDSVERQFESRDLALQQFEGENNRLGVVGMQLKESEAEAKELQEFLQAEKGTLAEALKEAEQEIKIVEGEVRNRETNVRQMEEQAGLLVRRTEQRSQELGCAKAEINGVKDRAREMLLAQGAELSRASVAISSLTSRLEQLVGVEGATWEENSNSDKSEESASDPAVNIDLHARRSSQFLVTPTESFDKGDLLSEFSRAMMTTSTGSDQLGLHSDNTSLQSLATTIQERQQLEGQGRSVGNITVPGLTEQLSQVEQLVAKLMCVNMARSHENLNNGNTNTNLELEDLDLENKDVTRSIIQVYKCFNF